MEYDDSYDDSEDAEEWRPEGEQPESLPTLTMEELEAAREAAAAAVVAAGPSSEEDGRLDDYLRRSLPLDIDVIRGACF